MYVWLIDHLAPVLQSDCYGGWSEHLPARHLRQVRAAAGHAHLRLHRRRYQGHSESFGQRFLRHIKRLLYRQMEGSQDYRERFQKRVSARPGSAQYGSQ